MTESYWPKNHPHDVKYYSSEQIGFIKCNERIRLTEDVTSEIREHLEFLDNKIAKLEAKKK